MDIVGGATRFITGTANATTAAAGAVGGAADQRSDRRCGRHGQGIRNGLSSGSNSTATAALTFGAIGAAGLIEWPVLLDNRGYRARGSSTQSPLGIGPRAHGAEPATGKAASATSSPPRRSAPAQVRAA